MTFLAPLEVARLPRSSARPKSNQRRIARFTNLCLGKNHESAISVGGRLGVRTLGGARRHGSGSVGFPRGIWRLLLGRLGSWNSRGRYCKRHGGSTHKARASTTRQTAEAGSIDTDTVMRWNQYVHESQMNSNRLRQQRQAGARERNTRLTDERQRRLRDNPDPSDIHRGDALNAALDEIDDPRVYAKALQGAKVKIGGENIREIPFRYASAAITFSIHQLTRGLYRHPCKRPSSRPIVKPSRSLTSRLSNRSPRARTLTPRPSRS